MPLGTGREAIRPCRIGPDPGTLRDMACHERRPQPRSLSTAATGSGAGRADRGEPVDDASLGPVRLRVSVPAPAAPAAAEEVLGPGRRAWVGPPVAGDEPGVERHLIDLELRVSEHAPRVAFRKAAYVDLGPVERIPERGLLRLPISWRAAGLTPLFPVFAGTLSWTTGELELDGYYAPPGGNVGQVIDRLLLNLAARATARRLLERIAAAMRSSS